MPNNEQALLGVSRETYKVPKGQEQSVHYKIAKLDSNGGIVEPVRLVKSGIKTFETIVKRNLELQGYTIEILHHPLGKYTDTKIIDTKAALKEQMAKNAELEAKLKEVESKSKSGVDAIVAEKEAEIAALKAKLAEARKTEEPEGETEACKAEGETEPKPHRGGRKPKEE